MKEIVVPLIVVISYLLGELYKLIFRKQEELYKEDLAKLEQINHEKLILTANYEVAKQELVTESLEARMNAGKMY